MAVGQRRILQLADNARYFRNKAKELGFIIYGQGGFPPRDAGQPGEPRNTHNLTGLLAQATMPRPLCL
jgi:hypothetical protein